jgi:quercetin dioxygenase-like cupin family protein
MEDVMTPGVQEVIVVLDGGAAESFEVLGERISVLVDRKHTGGHEVVLHVGIEGAGPPPHFHPWDEDFYVIDGEIDFSYQGKVVKLTAGGFIHFPAGTPHAFRHVSKKATALAISSPSGATAFFAAMDRNITEPPDFAKMVAVAHDHGVEVVGPPA